jgi:hypothetical protein
LQNKKSISIEDRSSSFIWNVDIHNIIFTSKILSRVTDWIPGFISLVTAKDYNSLTGFTHCKSLRILSTQYSVLFYHH